MNLTKLSMSQNVFQFNNTFLEQTNGFATGNLLYTFLAEICMSRFENDCRKKTKNFPEIWFRYVDDVFAMVGEKLILDIFF